MLAVVPVLPVHRLDPDLPLPSYARAGDAGLDLFAREGCVLEPGGGRFVGPCGIAVAVPEGWGGFVLPRSGLAARHGVTLANPPGLIDPGYRGEVKVVLVNTDPREPYEVHRGDRVAQLVLLAVDPIRLEVVDELEGEHRGGGFGHTGR
jgi:dUTP pyrophosphatase